METPPSDGKLIDRPQALADQRQYFPIPDGCLGRLEDRVPDMTKALLGGLQAAEPAYRDGSIPPAERPLWISRSLTGALASLRVPPAERPGTLEIPRTTGARRARQGVPLPALVRAYTMGGRLLYG